jgi:hypothetical protein
MLDDKPIEKPEDDKLNRTRLVTDIVTLIERVGSEISHQEHYGG